MLRCLTEEKKPLIASNCDEASTRTLSRSHKLFCPNCEGVVRYNKGNVKNPYFSHVNLECEYIGSEPETPSHIQGKQLLYDWLKSKFPTAYIEYEVHIPETGQIVDVYVKHRDGEFADRTWAFEFQHSLISTSAWEERHNLYESADIQDFWFFDKRKFMKFSAARDNTDARKRSDLEKTVFRTTGLVYFLDLDTSELTIDFNFIESPETKIIRGIRRTQTFTYHSPMEHSVTMSAIKTRKNKKYGYVVLISESLEEKMKNRLNHIYYMLERKEQEQKSALYRERLREKGIFSRTTYGVEFAECFKLILKDHNGSLTYKDPYEDEEDAGYDKELAELKEDIINLEVIEFFDKYKILIDTSIRNIADYSQLKENEILNLKILTYFAYPSDFKRVGFLKEQGSLSLKDYLTSKYKKKIEMAQYVYENHKDVLDWLITRSNDWINERLRHSKLSLRMYNQKPTPTDYAIMFKELNGIEEVEVVIQQIKDQIINYKFELDDIDFDD
ncbi:hypothetical protein GCM10010916_38510 [Paenibacillus abyssi]|uniref:Competence protein CoiA n=1 Tax=Paenibacillus abyssi TaxID=1340531 RepID=A0A917LFF0_9BACL|nr:hypothetical protein GCM10010916_38510 [Paenibacillus abyssi]